MSGGVDSSVAAALLQAEGHTVVGVTMQLWPEEDASAAERHGGCCAMGAVRDARRVAELLGIPYYVFTMREEFQREVVERFVAGYAAGRTPNPCVACNQHIKFRVLLDKARRMGAHALATGHHARVASEPDGWSLLRGVDGRKDQSYVLHPVAHAELPRLRFPVGTLSKDEVRAYARRAGLPTWDKPDSQEICFVGEEGYAEVVARARPEAARPGPIVDLAGTVLGQHRGLIHYTIGQRRGLGLCGERPLYVVALDTRANALVVAPAEHTGCLGCEVPSANWLVTVPPRAGTRVTAKVRSGPDEHGAVVVAGPEGGFRVRFTAPVRAVTPGQACVLYSGDRVLGGGEISRVERAQDPTPWDLEPLGAAVLPD